MKIGEIVLYDGFLGRVVKHKDEFKFLPDLESFDFDKLETITDISLGILSVPPCLYYYGIWTLHGSQCTSDTPAGELILIIITRIYFMVIEKKLRNTPES